MSSMAAAFHEDRTASSDTDSCLKTNTDTHESESGVYAQIDPETALLLEEIRAKYSSETNASIVAKAIRQLHDMTCRALIKKIHGE